MPLPFKKPTQAALDLRAAELAIIDGAVLWVAFVHVAPGNRRREEAASQEGAIAAGIGLLADVPHRHLAMIYAVDGRGLSTLSGNVDRGGAFTSAVTPGG